MACLCTCYAVDWTCAHLLISAMELFQTTAKPMKKSHPAAVGEDIKLLPDQLAFARLLAANEKRTRYAAVQALSKWLSAHTTKHTHKDMMKLWRGLFYCMWMCDKRPVQEELATKLASLLFVFQKPEDALMYLRCFMQTMESQWGGIDGIRLNKFYDLVTQFMAVSFEYALTAARETAGDVMDDVIGVYGETALRLHKNTKQPLGLALHVTDAFWRALGKCAKNLSLEIPSVVVLEFIERIYIRVMANHASLSLIKRVKAMLTELFDNCSVNASDEGSDQENAQDEKKSLLLDLNEFSAVLLHTAATPDIRQAGRKQIYSLRRWLLRECEARGIVIETKRILLGEELPERKEQEVKKQLNIKRTHDSADGSTEGSAEQMGGQDVNDEPVTKATPQKKRAKKAKQQKAQEEEEQQQEEQQEEQDASEADSMNQQDEPDSDDDDDDAGDTDDSSDGGNAVEVEEEDKQKEAQETVVNSDDEVLESAPSSTNSTPPFTPMTRSRARKKALKKAATPKRSQKAKAAAIEAKAAIEQEAAATPVALTPKSSGKKKSSKKGPLKAATPAPTSQTSRDKKASKATSPATPLSATTAAAATEPVSQPCTPLFDIPMSKKHRQLLHRTQQEVNAMGVVMSPVSTPTKGLLKAPKTPSSTPNRVSWGKHKRLQFKKQLPPASVGNTYRKHIASKLSNQED
eukprot:m.9369 g.9369  ORF g.9369 m.9369 type:complete len:690 (-) comp5444_c0_seq1:121-2190(-)